MVYRRHFWKDYDESKTETQNIEDGAVVTTEKLNEMEVGIDSKADKTYVDSMLSSIAQGGPRELFYSLAALKLKYPNGADGTYLVFDSSATDGAHVYIWDSNNKIWKDLGIYQAYKLSEKSVSKENTTFFEVGKNLFDKSKAVDGMYVLYTNGKLDTNPSFFATGFIPVQPNTTYTKNDNQQLAFYASANQESYLSGLASANTFTTPAGCYYVRISVRLSNKDTFQLEVGSITTDYEEYGLFLPESSLSKEVVDKLNASASGFGVLKVVKEGGSFNEISNAAALIKTGTKRTTIDLLPGEYTEILNIQGNKYVDVVGKNKVTTKLIDHSGDYQKCPLQVSGEGYFKDMTIIADHEDVTGELPDPTSYAAHIDYAGEGTLIFENVDFESYQNSAVGIGMHQNQTIIFRNCRIYNNSARGAAFYAHCNVSSGVANQRLILENCIIISENSDAIRLDDSNIIFGDGLGNDMTVRFINNYFFSVSKGEPSIFIYNAPVSDEYLCGRIKLDPMSHGNNIDILNAY